ncbi:MAG: hypothetical protein M8865_07835 [marine benthic group bacterium]|jgi:hypothetical protein|nr:hypothetical protein [Gemmatimonadota bacterium]
MFAAGIGRDGGGAGRTLCLAAALTFGLAGLACDDAPTAADGTSVTDALYKPGKGGGKPGADDPPPDETSPTLEFLASMSNGATPVFVGAAQPVSGGLKRNSLKATGSYTLTIQFEAADLATCDDGGARLAGLLGAHDGTIEVNVDRRALASDPNFGVVVNFETTLAGHDYFLTTGQGLNTLTEEGSGATVRKTGGFIRIVEDGDYGVWCPTRDGSVVTDGVVDFEFVFAE